MESEILKKIKASLAEAVTALCFLSMVLSAHGQQVVKWELKDDRDGIAVYTGNVGGSKFKALKVSCTFNATLSQMVEALMDVDRTPEWLFHTAGCFIVKQITPADLYYYSVVEIPWPVSNRDFVSHLKVSQDPASRVVTIDANCVEGMVAAKANMVRVTYSTGKWILAPVGGNQVKLTYTIHADPGGSIPAWLSNLFITQGPLQSIEKLRGFIQQPTYKNARLDYLKE